MIRKLVDFALNNRFVVITAAILEAIAQPSVRRS